MKRENEYVEVNIVDVLLDSDNTEPIVMYNDEGKVIKLEQIAVIPLYDQLYCILKPIDVKGIKENEAVVFEVVEEREKSYLRIETDELLATEVFEKYYELIEEEIQDDGYEEVMDVIKNDPNLKNTYDEETKELIDYSAMDIHPVKLGGEQYAIIKETAEMNIHDALVWKVVKLENGEKRLEWLENEELEQKIIDVYVKKYVLKTPSYYGMVEENLEREAFQKGNYSEDEIKAAWEALQKRKEEILERMKRIIEEENEREETEEHFEEALYKEEVEEALDCISILSDNELDLVEASIGNGFISKSWIEKYAFCEENSAQSIINRLLKLGIVTKVSRTVYKYKYSYQIFKMARKRLYN